MVTSLGRVALGRVGANSALPGGGDPCDHHGGEQQALRAGVTRQALVVEVGL